MKGSGRKTFQPKSPSSPYHTIRHSSKCELKYALCCAAACVHLTRALSLYLSSFLLAPDKRGLPHKEGCAPSQLLLVHDVWSGVGLSAHKTMKGASRSVGRPAGHRTPGGGVSLCNVFSVAPVISVGIFHETFRASYHG